MLSLQILGSGHCVGLGGDSEMDSVILCPSTHPFFTNQIMRTVVPIRLSHNPYFSAYFLAKIVFSLITNQPEQCFGLFFQRSEQGQFNEKNSILDN